MTFIFIDSNIYNRVATQAIPGCEESLFVELTQLVLQGKVTLLVPEVVTLEIEKFSRFTFMNKLASEVDQIHTKLKSLDGWNELTSMRTDITDNINKIKASRLEMVKARFDKINALIDSANVVHLPLNSDVMLACQRAALAGRMPSNEKLGGDGLLIETLVHYFASTESPRDFHFCSENHTHFAQELPSDKKKRVFRLHEKLQSGLPNATYCTNLKELVGYCKKTTSPPPSDSKPLPDTYSVASEDAAYCADNSPSHGITYLSGAQYLPASTVMPTTTALSPSGAFFAGATRAMVPGYQWWSQSAPTTYSPPSIIFVNEVAPLLAACRRTASWNDESEKELPNWLEGIPEDQLVNAQSDTLLTIYHNLTRYLAQHQELDRANRKRS